MSRQLRAFLGGLLCALCVFAVNLSADWPVFRGNALQTGVAETGLPDKLEILWKYETGNAIEGTAAIVQDTVYIGSGDEFLYALNLADGKPKWKYKAGAPIKVGVAVNGGLVYAGDEDGKFHCVDGTSGEKKWVFDTEAEITSAANFD